MGCLLSCIPCCFCSAAASCCCSCLPSCRSSFASLLAYSLVLVLTILLSAVVLIPGVRHGLERIPGLCSTYNIGPLKTEISSGLDCDLITGYGAVYRICFASTMFFLFFCLITIGVRSSQDFRAKIHKGFWFFKFLLWFGILVGSFFIPVEGFTTTWMVIGMIGGALYILIQLVLLMDFVYGWCERWLEAYEDEGKKRYAFALVALTLTFYAVFIVGVVLLYYFFASHADCSLNKAILSLNSILCVVVSVISVLPTVREDLPASGPFQASFIALYLLFFTWSGMTSGANPNCNPTLSFDRPKNETGPVDEVYLKLGWHSWLALLGLLCSILYCVIRTGLDSSFNKLVGGEATTLAESSPGLEKQEQGQTVWDDEEDGIAYTYWLFHLYLILATFYVMVTLTNWSEMSNSLQTLTANTPSCWVRFVSCWVCVGLYLLTLFGPKLFPNRQF